MDGNINILLLQEFCKWTIQPKGFKWIYNFSADNDTDDINWTADTSWTTVLFANSWSTPLLTLELFTYCVILQGRALGPHSYVHGLVSIFSRLDLPTKGVGVKQYRYPARAWPRPYYPLHHTDLLGNIWRLETTL